MNLCGLKVFLCLLVSYNLFTVATSLSPERTFHPALRQHAEFGEGIRDWFRGVRDKVRNFFRPATTTPPPPPAEIESVKQEIMNKFFLDLTNTRFNPDRDWGFRMGNWYFIKKVDDSFDDKLPDYVPTTTTETVEEFTREREELITSVPTPLPGFTEEIETLPNGGVDSTPIVNTDNVETTPSERGVLADGINIPETTIAESFTPTQAYIEAVYVSTTPIVETEPKKYHDNEIPSKDDQSAEVISPS